MWTCVICSKQVEDEENACYNCGADKDIAPEAVAATRDAIIAEIHHEIMNLPENVARRRRENPPIWRRNIFHLFRKYPPRWALAIYALPVLCALIIWMVIQDMLLYRTLAPLGHLIFFFVVMVAALWFIERYTRVYAEEPGQDDSKRSSGR
jgi:hypothetical protein